MGVVYFKIKHVLYLAVWYGFFFGHIALMQASRADASPSSSTGDSIYLRGAQDANSPFSLSSVIAAPTSESLAPNRSVDGAISSAPPLMIYGIQIDFRLDVGGQTQYNTLLTTLAADGLDFRMRIRSMRRSLRSFAKNRSSCIFPSNIQTIRSAREGRLPQDVVVSDVVDVSKVKVFSAHGEPVFTSLDQLKGKRIAYWGRRKLSSIIVQLDAFEETTHRESVRLKMLDAGRIDAIISPDKDVYIAAKELGIPRPNTDPDLIVWPEHESSLVCRDSPQGRAFVAEFNRRLVKLKNSGRLEQILTLASEPVTP